MTLLTPRHSDISGYILAGGRSRRFGQDKRILKIEGVTFLERAQNLILGFLGHSAYLVGDNLSELPADPAFVLPDAEPGRGPLGGLVTALTHSSTPWIMVIAVDLPFLDRNELQSLVQSKSDAFDVLTLSKTGEPEPLAGLYHCRTKGFWTLRLAQRRYSLVDGIKQLEWKSVAVDPSSRALDNINFPDDLGRTELR